MTQRQINLLFSSSTIALLIAAAASAAVAVLLPLSIPTVSPLATKSAAGTNHDNAPTTVPALASFGTLFDRQLRGPLEDAPAKTEPSPIAAPPTDAPLPSLTLVGFVGDSMALIRLADGSSLAVAIGDEVAGAKLTAIHGTQVELRMGDRAFTLEKAVGLPASGADPAANPRNFIHGY